VGDPLLAMLAGLRGKEREILSVAIKVDPLVKECMRESQLSIRDIKPIITRPKVIVTVDKEPMVHCGATYWKDQRVEISHDCWNILPEDRRIDMVTHELAHVYSEEEEVPEEKVAEVARCVIRKLREE